MPKILMVSTIATTLSAFFIPLVTAMREDGWTVDALAAGILENNKCMETFDHCHSIEWSRSPKDLSGMLKAYKNVQKIVLSGDYDIVHVNTPIASAVARLALRNIRKDKNIKIIYTAHGFHFYKGSPLLNWLVYYPIERFLSRYTDVLITINKEDFARVKTFHARKVEYVPGVGIDIDKIQAVTVDRTKKRKGLGIPDDAFLFISVGELNRNKNHEIVIRALSMLDTNDNLYYIIAGTGPLKDHLQSLIEESGLSSRIQLLGYRTDIIELLKISDCFVFPSLREGLPVALMEAITCGLFIVCSNIRGNTDLVEGNMTGYLLFQNTNMNSLLSCLNNAPVTKDKCGEKLSKKVIPFEQDIVIEQMKKVYSKCLSEGIRHE